MAGGVKSQGPSGQATARPCSEAGEAPFGTTGPTVRHLALSQKRDHGGPDGIEPEGVVESNWNEITDNFDDMNLKETLLRGI
ncbi:hypothetical protein NQZ68_036404 [Dissostichus eleginoides]|nr:hypothetical protein NQZ68_036404 [Dissostichus eleginoides]